jgi:hypothetical protein
LPLSTAIWSPRRPVFHFSLSFFKCIFLFLHTYTFIYFSSFLSFIIICTFTYMFIHFLSQTLSGKPCFTLFSDFVEEKHGS